MSRLESAWSRYGSLLCVFMLVTFAAYFPGLDGDFEFDDGVNILDNAALRVSSLSWNEWAHATLSGSSGPLGRPVSMASFALNYYFAGYSPYFYKLTNVLIHLVAGAGVFFLARQVAVVADRSGAKFGDVEKQHGLLAALVAGAWLLHPLNLTSVLYVVQRMTSLSALFTFFAVGMYILGRRKMNEGQLCYGWCRVATAMIPLTGLGMLSKENAVLAPMLMFCAEVVFFRFACDNKSSRTALKVVFACMFALPAMAMIVGYERIGSYIASGYLYREFTIVERLLTQPRVLLFYLQMLVLPRAGVMGLYHDDFSVSHGLFEPISTAISLGVIALVFAGGAYSIRRAPILAFAIFWFLISHALESSVIALEMVHEHRNYLASMGPLFACFYYGHRLNKGGFSARLKLGISVAAIAALGAVTFVRAVQWSNLVDHAAIEVHNHPESVTAHYQLGRLYFKLYHNDPRPEFRRHSEQHFRRSADLSTNSVFPLVGLIQLASKAGEPFDPALVETMKFRLSKVDWNPNMDAVSSLVSCQVNAFCKLPHENVTEILQTVIDNPRAGAKSLGAANSLMGNYLALKMDDLVRARSYLTAAISAENDRMQYHLDLLGLLAITGDFDGARQRLASARKIDKLGANKSRLDAEAQMIDRMIAERQKAAQ